MEIFRYVNVQSGDEVFSAAPDLFMYEIRTGQVTRQLKELQDAELLVDENQEITLKQFIARMQFHLTSFLLHAWKNDNYPETLTFEEWFEQMEIEL